MNIGRAIRGYQRRIRWDHHRHESWEHCYEYFRKARSRGLAKDRENAALQLGFFLASWGMYRGSSFLLQHTYTIHRGAIDVLSKPRFGKLWDDDFGAGEDDENLSGRVVELLEALRETYRPFARAVKKGTPSDTLVTKIVLGTVGCLPACDEYFIYGFGRSGFPYSRANEAFVRRVLDFC